MNDLIRDALELALRLETRRQAPVPPLRLAHHDRDGPHRTQGSVAPLPRATGPQNVAPANPAGISYRSRKVLP